MVIGCGDCSLEIYCNYFFVFYYVRYYFMKFFGGSVNDGNGIVDSGGCYDLMFCN